METLIKDFWAIIAAIGGFIIWLVRHEGLSKENTRMIIETRQEMNKMEIRLEKQRVEDLANRERDWSALRSEMTDFKTDMKSGFSEIMHNLRKRDTN